MSTKKFNQLLETLGKLCDETLSDTHKTETAAANATDKQLAFFTRFYKKLCSTYAPVIDKYWRITGKDSRYDPLKILVEDWNHFHDKTTIVINKNALGKYIVAVRLDHNHLEQCPTICLQVVVGGTCAIEPKNNLSRSTVEKTIKFIKSGQFDVEFANVLSKACRAKSLENESINRALDDLKRSA